MNSAETTTVQLRSGEKLTIEVCEPPFPGGEHSLCWWGDIAADLMAGNLRPWLYTPYYLGKIDGELVGYMGCQTPCGYARGGARRVRLDRRGAPAEGDCFTSAWSARGGVRASRGTGPLSVYG